MRVLIVAISFSANLSGIQRHALNLAHSLSRRDEISEIHFVVAPWQQSFANEAQSGANERIVTHVANVGRNSFSRNRWFYRELPKLATQLHVHLIHLTYPVLIDASAFPCPSVVTLHDWYPYQIPSNFGFPKFVVNRFILRQCLSSVDAIACVSETTQRAIVHYGSSTLLAKATTIFNIIEEPVTPSVSSPLPGWSGQPFLLCVAQHRRNKNLLLLLRAFAFLVASGDAPSGISLIITGIAGPETNQIKWTLSTLRLHDRVHLVEGLTEPELQWCYAHCEALVSCASVEGFGLSIAEAITTGCRIVCSDIPAHREVGDDTCRFVALDGNAESAFATAFLEALSAKRPAPRPLHRFSSVQAGEKYVELYQRLLLKKLAIHIRQGAIDHVADR